MPKVDFWLITYILRIMDSLLIILVLAVLILNVIFFIRFKKEPKNDENELDKIKNDFDGLKDSINQSFSKMSLEVSKDMTGTLSRVDEKVASFNKQVQEIQTSQNNFSRILAGVKQYGGLSEFSLATLLQDLLPASQYIANAKMKPDETGDVVEFAVKLQNTKFYNGEGKSKKEAEQNAALLCLNDNLI